GQLNAPWGLAMAPATFGAFGGDLLVGNFGDGHVNAFQEQPDGTWELVGMLRTADGKKLAIDGLWALEFGHGNAANGPLDTLFFTAGPNDESDGLFGTITSASSAQPTSVTARESPHARDEGHPNPGMVPGVAESVG